MADNPKPPEDITPDDYYLKWLPEQNAAADPAQKAKVKDINAVIQVVSDRRGRWGLLHETCRRATSRPPRARRIPPT